MIDGAEKFLVTGRNLTKDTNPEKDVFTQVEIDTLDKVITETNAWLKTETAAQKKLAKNADIRLTVKDITDKMSLLDREVKYLVNKIKIWKPKVKPAAEKEKKKEEEVVASGSGDDTKSEDAEQQQEQATKEEQQEQEPVDEITPTPAEEKTKTPHSEL